MNLYELKITGKIPSVFFESRSLSHFFRSQIFFLVLLSLSKIFVAISGSENYSFEYFSATCDNCLISNRQLSHCCCRVITSDQSFKEQTRPEQE